MFLPFLWRGSRLQKNFRIEKTKMKKFCFSCWSQIPLLATRCPHCISDEQSVFGRILISLVIIISAYLFLSHEVEKRGGVNSKKERLINLIDRSSN